MRIKLDRVLCNDLWLSKYFASESCFLEPNISDYSPMLVFFYDVKKSVRPFRYLNLWSKHEDFKKLVRIAWNKSFSGGSMYCLFQKLKCLKHELKKLYHESFSGLANRVETHMKSLETAQATLRASYTDENKAVMEKISSELAELLDAEDSYQRQMARDDWFKLYDRNTKYFYNIISSRR